MEPKITHEMMKTLLTIFILTDDSRAFHMEVRGNICFDGVSDQRIFDIWGAFNAAVRN